MTELPRWKAVATYRTDSGPVDVEHAFEELYEIHDIMERGPHWGALIDVRITLARFTTEDIMTVEQAEHL